MKTQQSPPERLYRKIKSLMPNIELGGSLLLKHYGLLDRTVKDLDLNTNDLKVFDFFKKLSKLSPVCSNTNIYYNPSPNHVRCSIDGIDICVWISSNKTTIKTILDAKKQYLQNPKSISYQKHLSDLEFISNKLINSPELRVLLHKNNQLPINYKFI
jgi:hypothetical protein